MQFQPDQIQSCSTATARVTTAEEEPLGTVATFMQNESLLAQPEVQQQSVPALPAVQAQQQAMLVHHVMAQQHMRDQDVLAANNAEAQRNYAQMIMHSQTQMVQLQQQQMEHDLQCTKYHRDVTVAVCLLESQRLALLRHQQQNGSSV